MTNEKSNTTFSQLIAGKKPVLVDFFAEWCGPCNTLKPILEDLKKQVGEDVIILKIDIDKNPGVARSYQIQGVPTLILFKNNQIQWRQSGVVPLTQLQQIISQYS